MPGCRGRVDDGASNTAAAPLINARWQSACGRVPPLSPSLSQQRKNLLGQEAQQVLPDRVGRALCSRRWRVSPTTALVPATSEIFPLVWFETTKFPANTSVASISMRINAKYSKTLIQELTSVATLHARHSGTKHRSMRVGRLAGALAFGAELVKISV